MPRLLVLTGSFIEYYRNETHFNQQNYINKLTIVDPIVKVPYASVAHVKRPLVKSPTRRGLLNQ